MTFLDSTRRGDFRELTLVSQIDHLTGLVLLSLWPFEWARRYGRFLNHVDVQEAYLESLRGAQF